MATNIFDIDKFESDLCAAQRAADRYRDADDGGTCNFDTVTVNLGRATKKKLAALAQLDWSVQPVGLRGWSGYWFVWFNTNGQADRRTDMVEAAAKEMAHRGYDVRVYYQMD